MKFKYGAGVLAAGIFLLLYFQTFKWLLDSWLYDPFYSHGFIVPVISLVMIWWKRNELKNITPEKNPLGIYVFTLGLILYVVGTLLIAFFLLGISLILMLIGLILHFYGKEFTRKLLFPLCFLIFMIPLPGLDALGGDLQYLTADNSVRISQAFGAEIYQEDLGLYVKGCAIMIGLPCSGLRSIISLLMFAAVFVYIIKGSFPRKAVILLMAVPIAIASNTIRVTLAILIANSYGCDAATTYFHDFSSIFLFAIAIALLILFSRILKCDIF